MPERWQCGHCGIAVEIPPPHPDLEAYATAVMFIREHRFGHIADAFIEEDDEAVLALCEDTPSGFDLHRRPVTSDDVAPALVEADRIVRGV